MGLFSRLLRNDDDLPPRRPAAVPERAAEAPDQRAIERYRYMLQTAPPETIEQAHQEAFERLTPEQRRQVLSALAGAAPPAERAELSAASPDDARALARAATRAEIREPGLMERTLSRPGVGFAGGLLGSFAAAFAGSLVAQSFLSMFDGSDAVAADDGALADEGDMVGDDGSFDLSDFEI